MAVGAPRGLLSASSIEKKIEPRTYGYLLYVAMVLTMWGGLLPLVPIYEVPPNKVPIVRFQRLRRPQNAPRILHRDVTRHCHRPPGSLSPIIGCFTAGPVNSTLVGCASPARYATYYGYRANPDARNIARSRSIFDRDSRDFSHLRRRKAGIP